MRRLIAWLRSLFTPKVTPAPAPVRRPSPVSPITAEMKAWASEKITAAEAQPMGSAARARAWMELFPPAKPPEWIPKHEDVALAMDEAVTNIYAYASAGWFGEGIVWPGYPYLAELTQRPEYRVVSETRAKEMTRKWIELTYSGEDDKGDDLKALEEDFQTFGIRDLFRKVAEHDGFFGRGAIYIDTGASEDPVELAKPLKITPQKIAKGSVKGFRTVEAMWMYPDAYDSVNPLRKFFFKPQYWFVMAQRVHVTRLLLFISRELPDILKPAYSFGGLSLSQILKPYVDWWLADRNSVSDLITNFSIVVWLTNMAASTQQSGAGQSLTEKADFFNAARSNRGMFIADKETEDVKNLAVPLGTLDALQAQSQEHMASIAQIPLVKLLGIQPAGLNASSDGEIRVFYDNIHALQQHIFADPLRTILQILQLNRWGKIDKGFDFKFVPLWQLDEAAEALVRKTDADTSAVYIESGVISPEEVRGVLAADKNSVYAGLDPDDLPEPPETELKEGVTGDPAKSAEPKAAERSGV